eukprot:GABV01008589.1.p1 GENE.GABV01008589.1~~GABV01008589.1.p1  ORF type:complete len:143 (-),score=39.32 GABV01008589.1:303-731(-)
MNQKFEMIAMAKAFRCLPHPEKLETIEMRPGKYYYDDDIGEDGYSEPINDAFDGFCSILEMTPNLKRFQMSSSMRLPEMCERVGRMEEDKRPECVRDCGFLKDYSNGFDRVVGPKLHGNHENWSKFSKGSMCLSIWASVWVC